MLSPYQWLQLNFSQVKLKGYRFLCIKAISDQPTKKVVSDTLGLVDFAIELVNSVLC